MLAAADRGCEEAVGIPARHFGLVGDLAGDQIVQPGEAGAGLPVDRPAEVVARAVIVIGQEIGELPTIDWKGVKELLACGVDELQAFAELVNQEIPDQMAEVRSALGVRDSKLLQRSAHSLKGSVNYFGVEELIQAALALELSGREGSFENTAEQLATLEREVTRFLAALEIGPPESIF